MSPAEIESFNVNASISIAPFASRFSLGRPGDNVPHRVFDFAASILM